MILDNSYSYVLGYIAAWGLLLSISLLSIKTLEKIGTRGWKYTVAANIVSSAIGIMLIVLSLEGYYGFFYDEPDSYGLLLTSKRWFERHYSYNNVGLRDEKDYYFEKEAGKKRIVFIGDSYTVGHGIKNIKNRFTGIIETRLNMESQGRYEVQTIAKNGWETNHEVDFFKYLIEGGFDADTVILCFNINDISWASPERDINLASLYGAEPQGWLLTHSYFLNFLYVRINILFTNSARDYYGWMKEAYSGPPWEEELMLLREFKKLCTKKGCKLKVAILPLIDDLSAGFKMKSAHDKMASFLKEEGIPYTDLADRFKKFPAKELTVNRFDAHPNEFAHTIIAEEIWNRLISPAN